MNKPIDVPYCCGVYSVEDIMQANERHDRFYGWSVQHCRTYTNLMRYPESTFAPRERAFERSVATD